MPSELVGWPLKWHQQSGRTAWLGVRLCEAFVSGRVQSSYFLNLGELVADPGGKKSPSLACLPAYSLCILVIEARASHRADKAPPLSCIPRPSAPLCSDIWESVQRTTVRRQVRPRVRLRPLQLQDPYTPRSVIQASVFVIIKCLVCHLFHNLRWVLLKFSIH